MPISIQNFFDAIKGIHNGEANKVQLTGSNPADTKSPSTGDSVALLEGFNGSNWDRWRNNNEGTLLASAARTATTASSNQINYNAKGVILTLNVTGNPGGTETLNFYVQLIDPITGSPSFGQIASLQTSAASNKVYRLIIYPGSSATPDSGEAKSVPLVIPRQWRGIVTPSGSGSWTYSLGYQYIL